jgi:hypothetical protein
LTFDSEEDSCRAALLHANPLELDVKKEPIKLAGGRGELGSFGPPGRVIVPFPT